MNKKGIFLYALLAGVAGFGLTSCNVLNNLIGNKNSKVEKAVILPSDREEIHKQTSLRTYTPQDIQAGIVKGDWAIEEISGKQVVGESPAYLKFDQTERRFYGNNGCNYLNGSYMFNPEDSTLSFTNVISTMKLCDVSGITDIDINVALNNTAYYNWSQDNDNYYLYLQDKSHQPLMTLMHQNFDFLNGSWQVVGIEDEPIDNPDVNIVIDVDEGKVHGNTGCNIFNGVFETDLETANVISMHNLITTRMACENPEYETRFLVALEDADHAKAINKDRVLLLNSSGKNVLTLERKR